MEFGASQRIGLRPSGFATGAVELGINFIRHRGLLWSDGVSEEIIAEALHPYPAGLVIATKGGFDRPGPDKWVENGKPEHLRSACEGSLRRLRLERIDLYQLHRIDPKVPAEDPSSELLRICRRREKSNTSVCRK